MRSSTHGAPHDGVIRVIVGPTAAGKSRVAMDLALSRGLSIISADSRQVYRGFDIGTAKPTRADRDATPHYGIDICDPTERYSAHAWASDYARWAADATRRQQDTVVVGGTGFYIRALVSPLDALPPLDPGARSALAAWLETLSPEALHAWTARLDPARARFGRTQQRRAVETALLAGVRLSASLGRMGEPAPRVVRYLVVDPGATLHARMEARVDAMFAAGWTDEVAGLDAWLPNDAPAWKASGYEAVRDCVRGELSLAVARERVVIATRQYAKRQRTWWRHQLHEGTVSLLNPEHPDAPSLALAWWDGSNLETV